MPNSKDFDENLPSLGAIGNLEWKPDETRVHQATPHIRDSIENAKEKLDSIVQNSDTIEGRRNAGIPDTPEDRAVVEAALQELRDEIDRTASRIQNAKQLVDRASGVEGDAERFVMNIENKRRLKRAMRKLFGGRHDSITPEHYKEAIRLKAEIEDKSANKHTRGK